MAATYTVHGHFARRDGRKEAFWTRTGLAKAAALRLAKEQRAEPGGVAKVVKEEGPAYQRAATPRAHAQVKKSHAQLDHEVDEILAARQKREARERATPSRARSSGIPSQGEYERRELAEARQKINEVERAPLADRKAAAADFLEAMRDRPALVAERIGWLLAGNYGYGPMQMAKRILGSSRMNRSAALTHMIAAFEWSAPNAMARAGWKKLTKGQQAALETAVQAEIADATSEE